MPNWCTNTLTVVGPDDDVDALIALVTPAEDNTDNIGFDFSRVVPLDASQDEKTSWGTHCQPNVYTGPVRVALPHGRAAVRWELDTAWAPPQPVCAELAGRYPRLRVTLAYEESSMDIHGGQVWEGGRHVAGVDAGDTTVWLHDVEVAAALGEDRVWDRAEEAALFQPCTVLVAIVGRMPDTAVSAVLKRTGWAELTAEAARAGFDRMLALDEAAVLVDRLARDAYAASGWWDWSGSWAHPAGEATRAYALGKLVTDTALAPQQVRNLVMFLLAVALGRQVDGDLEPVADRLAEGVPVVGDRAHSTWETIERLGAAIDDPTELVAATIGVATPARS